MTPWPGAFTFVIDGRSGARLRVAVMKAAPAETREMGTVPTATNAGQSPFPPPFPSSPGAVLSTGHDGIVVACGSGAVRLERVKPAGSREMTADEFARGHGISTGTRFASDE